jgi:hypothetical protein
MRKRTECVKKRPGVLLCHGSTIVVGKIVVVSRLVMTMPWWKLRVTRIADIIAQRTRATDVIAIVTRTDCKSPEENPRRIVLQHAWRYVAIRIYLLSIFKPASIEGTHSNAHDVGVCFDMTWPHTWDHRRTKTWIYPASHHGGDDGECPDHCKKASPNQTTIQSPPSGQCPVFHSFDCIVEQQGNRTHSPDPIYFGAH